MEKSNFLIVHRGALGDFILTWPCLVALRWHFSNHHFIGLGRPEYLELAKYFGLLDECLDSESQKYLPFFLGKLQADFGKKPRGIAWIETDTALEEMLKKNGMDQFFFHPPFPKTGKHVALHQLEALSYFNLPTPSLPLFFTMGIKPERSCLIHPGSGSERKNYDPEFYIFVANEIKNRGLEPRFVLGPNESRQKEKWLKSYPCHEPKTVLDLAKLISRHKLFIGNDSGVSHLAGVLGVYTIALYKVTKPSQWGVKGIRVENLEAPTEAQAMAQIQKALSRSKWEEEFSATPGFIGG